MDGGISLFFCKHSCERPVDAVYSVSRQFAVQLPGPLVLLTLIAVWISNYLSIPNLKYCNSWSLGMNNLFHPTLYWACDYLTTLGLNLTHGCKIGPGSYGYELRLRNIDSIPLHKLEIFSDLVKSEGIQICYDVIQHYSSLCGSIF